MFRIVAVLVLLVVSCSVEAQQEDRGVGKMVLDSIVDKATVDMYKIFTIEKDTTVVDTSLTINSDYRFNYLRKDNFGLMPYANVGQTYNKLDYSLNKEKHLPSFGFHGKHFNYLEYDEVAYYHVPTAYTELYYRSVMEQGQNVDALFTVNPSKNLNFSIAYKGLRSIGKYINVLVSTGNFRFTTSYRGMDDRYIANAHIVYQDMFNSENAGIKNPSEFEGGEEVYNERGTIDVNIRDANTMLKGNRFFLNHSFQLNKSVDNKIKLNHQIYADKRFFEYAQTTNNDYFGASFRQSQLNDRVDFRQINNVIGVSYESSRLGRIGVSAEQAFNSYYNRSRVTINNQEIPNIISDKLWYVGAKYTIGKKRFKSYFEYKVNTDNVALGELSAGVTAEVFGSVINMKYQNITKLPDYQYRLYQSDYIGYNWFNQFLNQNVNRVEASIDSKIVDLSADFRLIKNKMYFSNDSSTSVVLSPNQYGNSIGVASIKARKEIVVGKFALDNSILYQYVEQGNPIINLPEYVLRNTLYYSDSFFKKALYLQMGVSFNYFDAFYSDVYNPLLGSFYVQDQKKIGGYPVYDVFVNAKVKTARLYLKAEHVNSSFSKNNFYSAPDNPYRDFVIRFGIIWTFFN